MARKLNPFNFKTKNRASLRDLDGIMKRIIYPELFMETDRMNLRDQDYNFLRYWMSSLHLKMLA